MKSSSGKYFIALDHVRAVAVFIVFVWHFIHISNGHLAPPPTFPFSLLTEGHTGVALFMALSGYLFAKLLDGNNIKYSSFLWNRFLRLAPLLCIVIIFVGVKKYFDGEDILNYSKQIIAGIIKPTLPNGGWSITVEFHFYLILPLLLLLTKRWKYSLFLVLLAAVFMRGLLHQEYGQIQDMSYFTIIGRIDQFLLGIMAYQFRNEIAGKHLFAFIVLVSFLIFYWYFDLQGGFYVNPWYPSPNKIWIYMPLLEGFAYAVAIAWYDNSFEHSTGKISKFIALIGTYSYSIYMLHFFLVFWISGLIHNHVIALNNLHVAIVFAFLCFFLMIPLGYISYRFLESPFLKFRTRYIREE